jgi:non-ribosomal peptide synthetase component E (peptide arylation enzyme)
MAGTWMRQKADPRMGGSRAAPLLTLLQPSTVAAYTAAGFWSKQTIYDLVAQHARATPQAPVVRDRHHRLTYAELVAAVDRLAAHLAGHGIRPGQRIAVWLPSRVETAIALLACSRNGYVCCPSMHRDHTVREIVSFIDRVRAAGLIAQPGYGVEPTATTSLRSWPVATFCVPRGASARPIPCRLANYPALCLK